MEHPRDTDFGRSEFNYGSFVGSVTERFNSIDSKFQSIVEGMHRIEQKQDTQVSKMDESIESFHTMINELQGCTKIDNELRDKRISTLEQRQVFIAGGLAVLIFVLTIVKDLILKI